MELHFLDAPLGVLFDRIRMRNTEQPPVTLEDLKEWDRVFQQPSVEEMALFDSGHNG